MTLLINNEVAKELLTMGDCIEALEEAYKEEGEGSGTNRTKSNIQVPTENPDYWYRYCSMEGGLRKAGVVGIRIKSDMVSWPVMHGKVRTLWHCVEPGRYCGLILLLSARNGEPIAILNDGYIQHMRVGATAAIAAKFMAREDAEVVGIIGSGGMAVTHLQGYAAVRKVRQARVYSPNKKNRESYARKMSQELGFEVVPMDDPERVVRDAGIVACCTDAEEPVIRGEWIAPGAHVTCVKTREAGEDVFHRVARYVEYRSGMCEQHWTTPEDWRPPGFGGSFAGYLKLASVVSHKHQLTEVLLGKAPGRESRQEINFFESEGTGIQFAAVGYRVYTLARRKGLGQELPLDWFTQRIRN
jgi:ornithine cyclodeaminase/alanine dehydrogenase-like protein (mu-crystallin family)